MRQRNNRESVGRCKSYIVKLFTVQTIQKYGETVGEALIESFQASD